MLKKKRPGGHFNSIPRPSLANFNKTVAKDYLKKKNSNFL
jgi:hypothetical protein